MTPSISAYRRQRQLLSFPFYHPLFEVSSRPDNPKSLHDRKMKLTSTLIWALAALTPAIQAAVLAIDYGAEFTKLSLVKPGVPFDVVLDRDSKRKISSVVGWKRDDRVFGAEGKMAVSSGAPLGLDI